MEIGCIYPFVRARINQSFGGSRSACFSSRVRKRGVALLIKYCAKRLAKWKRRRERERERGGGQSKFFALSFCKSSIELLSRRFILPNHFTLSPFLPFIFSLFLFSFSSNLANDSLRSYNRRFVAPKDIDTDNEKERGIDDVTCSTWLISDQRAARVIPQLDKSQSRVFMWLTDPGRDSSCLIIRLTAPPRPLSHPIRRFLRAFSASTANQSDPLSRTIDVPVLSRRRTNLDDPDVWFHRKNETTQTAVPRDVPWHRGWQRIFR